MAQLSQQNAVLTGSIPKQILKLFFPIFFGTLFQQLYNTVDTLIVGNFCGTDALAAVGATGAFVMLMVGFFVGLTSGASIIISQNYGAGEYKLVDRQVHTALALSIACGALLSVLGLLLSRPVMAMMNTPADILDSAALYLRIFFLGTIPQMIYNTGTGILRAVGDTKRPLYFLIVASFTNIVLDILLVAVIPLGVAGAALATLISQIVSAILTIWWLRRVKDMPWKLSLRKLKLEPVILRKIFAIGLPSALQSSLYSISNIVIQVCVNSFGTVVVAAWSVYGKIDMLFWMMISSLGIALTTFTGQNFGAQHYDRVKRGTNVSMLFGAAIALGMSTLMYPISGWLFSFFSQDAAVIAQGIQMMHTLVPAYITYVSIDLISGALRGCGDVKVPTLITVFVVCLLRVCWIWFVVPVYHTIFMVEMSYPLSWTLASILFLLYYYKGNWLQRCIDR